MALGRCGKPNCTVYKTKSFQSNIMHVHHSTSTIWSIFSNSNILHYILLILVLSYSTVSNQVRTIKWRLLIILLKTILLFVLIRVESSNASITKKMKAMEFVNCVQSSGYDKYIYCYYYLHKKLVQNWKPTPAILV